MFYIRGITCAITIFLVSIGNARSDTCPAFPATQRFQAQIEAWSLNTVQYLILHGKADAVKISIRKAGCQLLGSDINSEIRSCRTQIKNDFGCKLAISLIRNNSKGNPEINDPNVEQQCCCVYRDYCKNIYW